MAAASSYFMLRLDNEISSGQIHVLKSRFCADFHMLWKAFFLHMEKSGTFTFGCLNCFAHLTVNLICDQSRLIA